MSGQSDQARFATVVVPHLAEAFALACWLTGNRTDAEDVVQEASLRAFRAIGSNTTYSWLAKNRRVDLIAAECDVESASVTTYTPETVLIAKAEAGRLEAAVAALPLEFREVLVLRDVQGLEYREIAEVTGLPVGTVMSRLARTRRRLIDAIRTDEA